MPNTTGANVWPTFHFRDARAEIAFLQEAFGFELVVEYANAEDPERIYHTALAWPEGGGV